MAKPVLKARITVQKNPAATSTGNVSFMDVENKRHFGDAVHGHSYGRAGSGCGAYPQSGN